MDAIPCVSESNAIQPELGGGLDAIKTREDARVLGKGRVIDSTDVFAALFLCTRAARAAAGPAHRVYGRSDGAGQGNDSDE